MCAHLQPDQLAVLEGYVPVENARLYYREIGRGQPIVILHGGPDFDHNYLLPEMDRLADIRFVLLKETGHFSYLERPDAVAREIEELFRHS